MSNVKREYQSLLSDTANTRDLGGYRTASGRYTVRNRIWRSDAPTVFDAADRALLEEYNIQTIVDLRTGWETEKCPCAYARDGRFVYHHFPITAGSVPPSTLEEVPETYLEIAAQRETAEALRAIAEAETGVLFCCTAGKDRTGVVSAILLLACGGDHQTIIADYAVSREYNRDRLEKYLSEHPEVDRRIVLANEISMQRFIEMFLHQYGSVEGYFERSGLTTVHLDSIRGKLTETNGR